jgi:hypothetical protein
MTNQRSRENWRRYYYRTREARLEYLRKYRAANRQRLTASHRAYVIKHRDKIREYDRKWKLNWRQRIDSLNYRLGQNLRRRLRFVLHGQQQPARMLKLLGCSIEDFKIYIESKFESGMSWENYGRDGWHIDHIMPCAIFDLSKPDHQKRCFHFSNMQPMWGDENIRKRGNTTTNQFSLL